MISPEHIKPGNILVYKMLADLGTYKYQILHVDHFKDNDVPIWSSWRIICRVVEAPYSGSVNQERTFDAEDLEDMFLEVKDEETSQDSNS